MNIKYFLFLVYGAAGFGIAVFTAFMTYLIIGEPIGYYMFSKILLTVILTVPVIWIFSQMIGNYFAKKIEFVKERLHSVMQEEETQKLSESEYIGEFAVIHQDIEILESRLYDSIDKLREKNKSQTAMMRSLAHDINTPLTIIQGYLEELEDGLHPQKQLNEIVSIMKKETDYLRELSNDSVEYLRSMQEGREKEPIALKQLVEKEVFPLLHPQKNVVLRHRLVPQYELLCNRVDLKKILLNLLHNSCKYTAKGSIEVAFESEVLSVSDTGIGIEPEIEATLFEPLTSLQTTQKRSRSGFGMGLSIASNLAESNGYKLQHDKTYISGTRFLLKRVDQN